MTSTAEDTYAGRTSGEFPYDEVMQQTVFDSASLLSCSMKRYGNGADRGYKAGVTTFANWWILKYDAEQYFPLQVAIEVQGEGDIVIGRIEADYQVSFYSFLTIEKEHFSQLVEDLILPRFWEMANEFLCNAMIEMGFDHGLLEDKINDYKS